MNLADTLITIAAQLGLDAQELIAYADEDSIGGYHTDAAQSQWLMGSIWGVEGQILYALIRATQPQRVIECGSYYGCSTHHILEALYRNQTGKLTSIDNGLQGGHFAIAEQYRDLITPVQADALHWLQTQDISDCDFLFEDMLHTEESTASVWMSALRHLKAGALVVSHDAAHYAIGHQVQRGVKRAGGVAQVYLTEPAQCGLAIGRVGT